MSRAKTALVLGAGLNGLAAAIRLARAGVRVRVLERRDRAGGLAAAEEFHPGYRVTGIQHGTAGLRRRVVEQLALTESGLRFRDRPAATLAPELKGPGLVLRPGEDLLPEGLAERSPRDADAWNTWRKELSSLRPVLDALIDAEPPEILGAGLEALLKLARPGLAFRRLGADAMGRILRAAPMCAEDLLSDLFEDPLLRAFLASRGIEGARLGPRSAGSGALLLLRELAGGPGVVGGPAALIDALFASAKSAGVEFEFGSEVSAIRVEDLRVVGVETRNGQVFDAELVLSGLGVKQTIASCSGMLPVRLRRAAERIRSRGTTAAVRLALSAPLRFRCRDDSEFEFARVAHSTLQLERAFDCAKHRRPVEMPWLDVCVPSIAQPEFAPPGHASVSILVHSAAIDLEGGWTDSRRRELCESVLDQLEPLTRDLRDCLVGSAVLAPPDLEHNYGLDGGHPMHAELGLDQLWVQRPSVHFSRYRTEVAGLFLGGRATHPGGDFLAASGLLAAEMALRADS